MATFISSFKDRAICVPLIQRDYVQSFSTDIIESFVDQLIDALSDTTCVKSMNLNYIYGIDRKRNQCMEFEPVDGQQRLTTLWLLCLYVSCHLRLSSVEPTFDVRLIYQSRELADDFCSEIIRHKSWAQYSDDFEKHMENQSWFVPEWKKDTSIVAMNKTLGVIARKLARFSSTEISYIWGRLRDRGCPVTFSFYPTDTLGDDVYIKMNGRGRSLTSFENLKSWIDERLDKYLPDLQSRSSVGKGTIETFYDNWKDEMDNAWTNLFWSNRESGSYEIDDMQLRLFYNLVYLYWSLEDKNAILTEGLKPEDEKYKLEELAILLGMGKDNISRQDIIDSILGRIIKSTNYSLPLYVLDKINLFPMKFLLWLQKVLNGLCSINDRLKNITDREIFFWGRSLDKDTGTSRTLLYQIMMSERGQERVSMEKLALCYALCKYACFHDKTATALDSWMYRCRNLILNNSYDSKTFGRVLQGISALFENSRMSGIDVLLKQDNLRIDQFPEKYIRLEQYKSEILLSGNIELATAMKKLENKRFFVGSILCLPLLISSEEAAGNPSKFLKICHILSSILHSDGPVYDDKFRRALLYFSDPAIGYGGWEAGGVWSFLSGKGDWQWYFNDSETDKSIQSSNRKALKGVVDYLLQSDPDDYERSIDRLISLTDTVQDRYPILRDDDWRYPFVYYPKVFGYMNVKCCRRNPPYDIILSKSTVIRTNADHVSLQTYLLYREYRDGKSSLGDGWEIGIYQRQNTCVVFVKGKLKITVEFMNDENKADAYSIRAVVRMENDDMPQNIREPHLQFIIGNLPPGQKHSFSEEDGLRINDLAYEQVKRFLADIMS